MVPPSDGELDRIIDSLRRIGQRIQTSNGNIGSFLEKGMTELRQETKKVQEGRQSSRAYTRKGDLERVSSLINVVRKEAGDIPGFCSVMQNLSIHSEEEGAKWIITLDLQESY